MRLPTTAHTERAWRIHEITPDFRLHDVWALPTPGGPGDFPRLVELFAGGATSNDRAWPSRALFAVRWKLGALLGWDDPEGGLGGRVPSLRDRLPEDLRHDPAGPDFPRLPFSSIFLTDNEFAAELANRTCHGVLHLGWVPDGVGGYTGQMAVLVKPNGVLGALYMAGITPFRYLGVYPTLLRTIGREWESRTRSAAAHTPPSTH